MRIYAHILTWNDRRYLPDLFKSLEVQTHEDLIVRVLDNGSTDGSLEYIQEKYPRALVGRNVRNQGFAGGHNQLLRFTFDHLGEGEDSFVVLINADMILDDHAVERLVEVLKKDATIGSVQPKVYRAFGENLGDEVLEQTVKSEILDTTGLRVRKGFRMSDRGAGEMDAGQYDEDLDIFGPSGAMVMFRLGAIRSVELEGEWFDGDFFTYREDCDLAWRMRRAGWKSLFTPTAIAYHYRGMYGAEKQGFIERLRNRRSQRPFFAAHSTRNQFFMLVKNLSFTDTVIYAPWLFFFEGIRFWYGMVFEPRTRRALLRSRKLFRCMRKKRKALKEYDRVPKKELRTYVS